MPARRAYRRPFSAALRERELGLSDYMPSLTSILGGFRTTPDDEYGFWNVGPNNIPTAVPPFTISFSTTALEGHALLAADEEGVVTVLDTRRSLNAQMRAATPSTAPVARFRGHDNAIFDAVWLSGDTSVATASGDGSARVFDVASASRSALLRGHAGSVKCVRSFPSTPNVILTAARDGHIRAFDIRVPSVYDPSVSREMFHKPMFVLENAHAPIQTRAPARKRRRVQADPPKGSVTALTVMPHAEHLLFSSGAADGTVKLWDVRGSDRRRGGFSAKCVSQVTPGLEGAGGRSHGIASLDVDAGGRYLAVSATDSTIYMYDAGELRLGCARKLVGHTQTSFFIRARFSPCGNFVLSGSADSRAYIWDLTGGEGVVGPSLMLDGHRGGEAAGVDWCKADGFKVATCGDDATAKVWTVVRGERSLGMDEEGVGARKVEWVRKGVKNGRIGGRVRKAGVVRRQLKDADIRSFFDGKGKNWVEDDRMDCSPVDETELMSLGAQC